MKSRKFADKLIQIAPECGLAGRDFFSTLPMVPNVATIPYVLIGGENWSERLAQFSRREEIGSPPMVPSRRDMTLEESAAKRLNHGEIGVVQWPIVLRSGNQWLSEPCGRNRGNPPVLSRSGTKC